MKFNTTRILISGLTLGLAKANFFEGIQRAEFFELSEFNMPTVHIHFSDEAYSRFKLNYKCTYDTHPLVDNVNEDCYTAPWVNYNEIINKLKENQILDIDKLSFEQQNLINDENSEISYEDFKTIIDAASSLSLKNVFSQRYDYSTIPSYEEKKASIELTINGEKITKDSVKFSIGGRYTKGFEKPQFNLKIKNGDLYGRELYKLRSEVIDPSFLRSKIGSDLTDILGLPSIHASFIKVLINGEDMGLYSIRDTFKPLWVESHFGVANTTSLYKCDSDFGDSKFFNCLNDETEDTDDDIETFNHQIENAQSVEELSQFFDVDLYIKWQAYKYLTGSWDHVTYQHNQYLYKNEDKWMNFLYDFDSDFGAYKTPDAAKSFEEESLEMDTPLYKLLGLNDEHPGLIQAIQELVTNGFNPAILFPRIDDLIAYLRPYIIEDRNPEDDSLARPGHYPKAEYKIENSFTVNDFLSNAEYGNYHLKKYFTETDYDEETIYGLKRWIIERFRFVCTRYNLDCSFASEFLEGGNYEVPNNDSTEVTLEEHQKGCRKSGYPCCITKNCEVVTTDEAGDWCIENTIFCLINYPLETPDESIENNNESFENNNESFENNNESFDNNNESFENNNESFENNNESFENNNESFENNNESFNNNDSFNNNETFENNQPMFFAKPSKNTNNLIKKYRANPFSHF